MRLAILALLCGCNTPEKDKDTAKSPDEEVDDGWSNHAFTAYAVSEEDGYDHRLTGCSTQLAYQTWHYDGDAELTLVVTPGRTEYTDKYHHVVRMIEEQDLPWNVVIWDPYGQGRSGGVRAHITNWDEQFVCDLDVVIRATVDPSLPVALAAHSMGGLITMRWQQLHPGEVVAATFSAPMFGLYFEGYTEAGVCVIAAGGGPTTPLEAYSPRPECNDPSQNVTHDCEQYDLFYQDPLTEIGSATWGWVNASCGALKQMRLDAHLVLDDVLILQAGLDTVVSMEAQDEMCGLINDAGGSCELSLYPSDFHEILQEVDRAQAVSEMVGFIRDRIP